MKMTNRVKPKGLQLKDLDSEQYFQTDRRKKFYTTSFASNKPFQFSDIMSPLSSQFTSAAATQKDTNAFLTSFPPEDTITQTNRKKSEPFNLSIVTGLNNSKIPSLNSPQSSELYPQKPHDFNPKKGSLAIKINQDSFTSPSTSFLSPKNQSIQSPSKQQQNFQITSKLSLIESTNNLQQTQPNNLQVSSTFNQTSQIQLQNKPQQIKSPHQLQIKSFFNDQHSASIQITDNILKTLTSETQDSTLSSPLHTHRNHLETSSLPSLINSTKRPNIQIINFQTPSTSPVAPKVELNRFLKICSEKQKLIKPSESSTTQNWIINPKDKQSDYNKQVTKYLSQYNRSIQESENDQISKNRLKKVANNIISAKRLTNISKTPAEKILVLEKLKQQQYLKELGEYSKSKSLSNLVFLKEFYYKILELISIANSKARAVLMLKTILGFNQIISQVLLNGFGQFHDNLSAEFLDKQTQYIQSHLQSTQDQGLQTRRLSLKGSIGNGGDVMKDMFYFYKNLCMWVDEKIAQQKTEYHSQSVFEYEEIQKIIKRYTNHTSSDLNSITKQKCFDELNYTSRNEDPDELPYFMQPNLSLENIEYFEKHLGKFPLISQHVRQKDAQIASMCKAYALI